MNGLTCNINDLNNTFIQANNTLKLLKVPDATNKLNDCKTDEDGNNIFIQYQTLLTNNKILIETLQNQSHDILNQLYTIYSAVTKIEIRTKSETDKTDKIDKTGKTGNYRNKII